MADEGAVEMLLNLLETNNEIIQRQAAKAIANLSVNHDNKLKIGQIGGIAKLVALAGSNTLQVKIEAIAALGNLAVNDYNELEIVKQGALGQLASSAMLAAQHLQQARGKRDREMQNWEELAAQCARCLRNLTVNPLNRSQVTASGVVPALKVFGQSHNERIAQQSSKALRNLSAASTSISSSEGAPAPAPAGPNAARAGRREKPSESKEVAGPGEGKEKMTHK